MRLVIISTMNGFSWGGSEELWWHAALHANKQGHTVNIVVFESMPVHKKLVALQQQGIHVDFIGEQEVIIQSLWKKVLGKLLNKHVPVIYRDRFSFIHSMNVDFILLSQGGTTDITYYPDLKHLFDNLLVPYAVLNQHHKESGLLSYEQKKILLKLYKGASNLFFVAHRNKEVLERQLATLFLQAEIVKNPVNLLDENILPWPVQQLLRFAVVARLDIDFKGQDILLQTLAQDKWKDREFEVSFFGHGPHKEYLRNLIVFYSLEKKVFLKGQSDNIANVWQHHHVLILPSHSEGLPLSLVEAMLCGRPCLITNVGDSATLIKDNKTGWIASTASVRSLDESLERVWQQRSAWQTMGMAAHEDAKQFVDPYPGKTLFEKLMND